MNEIKPYDPSKHMKPWEGKRMTLNDYQEAAAKTANFHGCMTGDNESPHSIQKEAMIYCSLGLTGEAGEVVENTKKYLRDDNSELTEKRKDKFLGELGDVLWYLSNLSHALGFTLEEVAEYNIVKLQKRYEKKIEKPKGPANWEFKTGQQPDKWKKVGE